MFKNIVMIVEKLSEDDKEMKVKEKSREKAKQLKIQKCIIFNQTTIRETQSNKDFLDKIYFLNVFIFLDVMIKL